MTGSGSSSPLERRYRRALALLPAGYRQRWEEEMVATYLDGAHAEAPGDPDVVDVRRPTWSELSSVVALAGRLRLGGHGATPGATAWGQALRQVCLVVLLINAANALSGLVHRLSTGAGVLGGREAAAVGVLAPSWRRQATAALDLVWVAAFACAVLGRRRSARLLTAIAFLSVAAPLVGALADHPAGLLQWPVHPAWWFVVWGALAVVGSAALHRDALRPWSGPWLFALPAVTVLVVDAPTLARPALLLWVDPTLLACVGIAAATAVIAVRAARAGRPPAEAALPWLLTLAVLAPVVLGQYASRWAQYVSYANDPGFLGGDLPLPAVLAWQVAVLVLVTGWAFAGSRAGLRRLRAAPGAPAELRRTR